MDTIRFRLLPVYVILCASAVTSQILPGGGGNPLFPTNAPTDAPTTLPPVVFPPRQNKTLPVRTLPGMPGFPELGDFYGLAAGLDGELLFPTSIGYTNATMMYNFRTLKFPHAQIMATSVEDVQTTVMFAKRWNLMVAVRSSGHSCIGRSTYDGAVIINLARMKGKSFNLNSLRSQAGEVTLESGNTWLEVYDEVEKQVTNDAVGNPQRRVIVGGSAHTVAMGGYTLGGGHSPMSRQLGLAVDSLLAATIVLADGRKAVVNEQGTTITTLDGATSTSNDNSLFWAIRGGGGGTWGVVTDFTFKLHYAPARFRNVAISWSLSLNGNDVGSDTIRYVIKQLAQMSPQWGGFLLVGGPELDANNRGFISVFLNHFGTDQDISNSEVQGLLDHNPNQHQYVKTDFNFDTFIQYEETVKDPAFTNTYTSNTFIQPDIAQNETALDEMAELFMGFIQPPSADSSVGCTGTLIGGKMRDVAEGQTAVNPKFRSGLLSLSCGVSWPPLTDRDSFFVGHSMLLRDRLSKLGEGSYFSVPAEDLDDWKQQFWGNSSTYDRLLQIKRQWDPDHFFWCHNCVGSDDVTSARSAHS